MLAGLKPAHKKQHAATSRRNYHMSIAARCGLLVLLAAVSACGGGGGSSSSGGGGGGGGGQPTILATAITFPAGGVPPGFINGGFDSAVVVQVTDQNSVAITNASVTVDGGAAAYVSSAQAYEAALNISPGATVTVNAVIDGTTYSAAHANFSTYPTINVPSPGTNWSSQANNLVSWSGVVPDSTAQYAVGVFDQNGNIVWPAGGKFMQVAAGETSVTVDANSLQAGSYLILVGLIDGSTFPGATSGSGLAIGAFAYVPVSVSSTPAATVQSVSTSPATVTVGIGTSAQLTATATYSDGTTQDVTTQATWSSLDATKVTVSNSGAVTGIAAGATTVTAQFSGFSASTAVTVFLPNPSPVPPLTTAVAYQGDYAHSGRSTVGASGPTFPPTAHWSTTLSGTSTSYPVIAGGLVFVTTNAAPQGALYGTTLYALDETSGNVVWGPTPLTGTYSFANAAYDHASLFVIDYDGLLRAYNAANGSSLWSVQLVQSGVTSPPTAVNGIVYISGGGGLTAVDETNGATLWTAGSGGADHSSPAVSTDGVFTSGPCDAFKFDPLAGTTLWHFAEGCSGGGGKTSAYANNSLYVRQLDDLSTSQDVNLVLSGASGAQLGTFAAGVIPAFSDTAGFFLYNNTLTATSLSTGATLWTFTGDGMLVSAPLVIDGTVVIASSSGNVYALNAANGSVLWSGSAGAAIAAPDEQNATLTTGLGSGDGYLVVPAGNVLNGWRIVP